MKIAKKSYIHSSNFLNSKALFSGNMNVCKRRACASIEKYVYKCSCFIDVKIYVSLFHYLKYFNFHFIHINIILHNAQKIIKYIFYFDRKEKENYCLFSLALFKCMSQLRLVIFHNYFLFNLS